MTLRRDTKWDKQDVGERKPISHDDKKAIADYYRAALKTGRRRGDLLEELEKKYGRSGRQIDRYMASVPCLDIATPLAIRSEQEIRRNISSKANSYEETTHKRRMRKLARALAERITLPGLWDNDLRRNLLIDPQPGDYFLSIGHVQIDNDRDIKVTYPNPMAALAEPHLIKGLSEHLRTSGLPECAQLVSGLAKVDHLVADVEQHFFDLLQLLALITDEIKRYGAEVLFQDEVKPGLTRDFILTVYIDAVSRAARHNWIIGSWYVFPQPTTQPGLWQLQRGFGSRYLFPQPTTQPGLRQFQRGSYAIGIANNTEMLKTYQEWHMRLSLKYAEHSITKEIAERNERLSKATPEISETLKEFSDMQYLPGRCKLC